MADELISTCIIASATSSTHNQSAHRDQIRPVHPEDPPSAPQVSMHPISPTTSDVEHHSKQSPDTQISQLATSLAMVAVDDCMSQTPMDEDFCKVDVIRSNHRLRIPLIKVEGKVVSSEISSGGRREVSMASEDARGKVLRPRLISYGGE